MSKTQKSLKYVLGIGFVDLIFQIELNDKEMKNKKLSDINSLKDLQFLKKNKEMWNFIKLKGGNDTLNHLLIGNEYFKEKYIIDYIGFGTLNFEKEVSFFYDIYKHVCLRYFLFINDFPLDKNANSTLIIELIYKGKNKIINYESNVNKEVDKYLIKKNNNKPKLKRSESIFCNMIPYFDKYNVIFINYSDIKNIPGDFVIEDLFDLFEFYYKKGSYIFINFYEVGNNDDSNNNGGDDIFLKIIELIKKYNLSQLLFFLDVEQSQKKFQDNYTEKELFNCFINNTISSSISSSMKKEIKEKIIGLFLNKFENYSIISTSALNKYDCKIFPPNGKKEELIDIKKRIKYNIVDYYSILIYSIIYSCTNFTKNSDRMNILYDSFKAALELIELNKIKRNDILFHKYYKDIDTHSNEDLMSHSIATEIEKSEIIELNIIYLIDITYSMNKYKELIFSIEEINKELKEIYNDVEIGYVLYKDFKSKKDNKLKLGQSHIIVIKPSSDLINIKDNSKFKFDGGEDYAEDWANPLYEVSKLELKGRENIIIHLCDSGAHGFKFSDYCRKNEQEKFLVEALKLCNKSKIKIIGIILNNYAKKSFLECKKIYKENKGYYNCVDITKLIKDNKYNNDKKWFINTIKENIKNALNNKEIKNDNSIIDTNKQLNNLEEEDFTFKEELVKMRKISQIGNYKNKKFTFLPKITNDNKQEIIQGIKQGHIADCYLISSILSMVSKFPLIFQYIFPKLDYNENSDLIKMYIFENGIRKLISFKNTYATSDGENLLFAKPYNNELYGICLEKGYAVAKSQNSIQSGYKEIIGGSGYQVFEVLLGTASEKYISNHEYFKNYDSGYKCIEKNKLKEKIINYIKYGGMITFGVFYIKGAHEYSLQGYKIDDNNEMILEIINPHRSGGYIEENIFVQEDYEKLDQEMKKQFDELNKPKINENEFNTLELKESLKQYPKTGFLLIKFDTFFNWFGTIDICDPMFGSNEQTIIFLPDGSKLYTLDLKINNETKFKAYLTFEENEKKINSEYKIELKNNDNNNLIKNEETNDLIYEYLKKGSYNMKITSNNNNNEIKSNIYLKIQSYDKIELNINQTNNNIIIIENDEIFSEVNSQLKLMNLFFKKFYIWSHNNKLDFFTKPPGNNIINTKNEIIESNGMLTFPNFYLDYNNTDAGFILNIVNKYLVGEETNIEFNKDEDCYYGSNKYGKFKITKNLVMKDFDKNFRDYLRSKGILTDEIDLTKEKDEFIIDNDVGQGVDQENQEMEEKIDNKERDKEEKEEKEDDKKSTATQVEQKNCCCNVF